MSELYINTRLSTTITLKPNNFDNNIYSHLKNNLINKLEGKCFGRYGYISKIYEILERKPGIIVAENPMASASFDIIFSARLCVPLKNRQIICRVEKINKLFVKLSSGPALSIIITLERINKNVFFIDQNMNLRYKAGDKSHIVNPGDYIKVTILAKTFNDMDVKILIIGYLEDMATAEQVKQFYESEYDKKPDKLVDFDEYMKIEEDDDNAQPTGQPLGTDVNDIKE